MLLADVVRSCYRYLLGREAENEDVIEAKSKIDSYDVLFNEFLECDEYKRKFPVHLWDGYSKAKRNIDVHVSDEVLLSLFERTRAQWSKLGDENPYWSVLTDDAFHGASLDAEARQAFFETGAKTVQAIDAFIDRSGVAPPSGLCVELGCGVGRVTAHLARRFDQICAIDISPRNLEICRANLISADIHNVDYVLLEKPGDIELIPAHNFLFSTIVLQHNPPPIQYYIVEKLISVLKMGGFFMLQVPTNTPGYSFSVGDYLNSELDLMDLHDLPMADLFRIFARHDAWPLEVMMDGWTGLVGSHTFFGIKGREGLDG